MSGVGEQTARTGCGSRAYSQRAHWLRGLAAGLLLIGTLGMVTPASAQSDLQWWRDCKSEKSAKTDPQKSIAACTAILARGNRESRANQAGAYYNRGSSQAERSNHDAAIADYTSAIAINSRYADAYFGRGTSHSSRSNWDSAIADFTKAIAINRQADAYVGRGAAHASRNDYDAAIADYRSAISINPRYAMAHGNLGLSLERKADLQGARRALARAGELCATVQLCETAEPYREALARVDAALAAQARPAPNPTGPTPPVSAAAQRRIALVIGNSGYGRMARLQNPGNDAREIAALLNRAGFETVQPRLDLGLAALRRAVSDFEVTAQGADVALVYFAGHGVELNGESYLLPVDAALQRDVDVPDEALALSRVLRAAEGARRLRLVIIDACRDNPFLANMRRTTAARNVTRGLAPPPETGADMLIAFAARAGSIAVEGEPGGNSPFTRSMLRHLAEPGLDLQLAFRRVRDEVLAATNRRQEPFTYGSLGGETVSLFPLAR
jgi:tetratricopeptide (TPR) repeat protein